MPPGFISATFNSTTFEARLRRLQAEIDHALEVPLRQVFENRIKREYVNTLKREFPPEVELQTLMEGEIIRKGNEIFCAKFKGGGAPKRVGTTEDGRLIRGTFHPISRVLAQTTPQIIRTGEVGRIRIGDADAFHVRIATQFAWNIVVNGKAYAHGTTKPFGSQYLQVLEHGGSVARPNIGKLTAIGKVKTARFLFRKGDTWVWRITHRKGRRLWPEPNVYVWQIHKTVRPISMFRRAFVTQGAAAGADLTRALTRRLGSVWGFGG